MVMSTPTLAKASQLLASSVLVDRIQLLTVGAPTTVGFEVVKPVTKVGAPISALVQTTVLANAIESRVESTYSIKVAQGTALAPGQVVEVTVCAQEPALVGKRLLIDKVSLNGVALLRKAVASAYETVNQEGKEGL